MRAAYRELFLERVTRVDDSNASGDQIVDLCVRLAPPGQRVSLLGAQNIKGTGLDWVYRWLAVDAASRALARLASPGSPSASEAWTHWRQRRTTASSTQGWCGWRSRGGRGSRPRSRREWRGCGAATRKRTPSASRP